jgi:hypothetical protein
MPSPPLADPKTKPFALPRLSLSLSLFTPPRGQLKNASKTTTQQEGHNAEVKEATQYLLSTTIPAFARWLDEQHALNESASDVLLGGHAGKIDIEAQLTELLHMEGTLLTPLIALFNILNIC